MELKLAHSCVCVGKGECLGELMNMRINQWEVFGWKTPGKKLCPSRSWQLQRETEMWQLTQYKFLSFSLNMGSSIWAGDSLCHPGFRGKTVQCSWAAAGPGNDHHAQVTHKEQSHWTKRAWTKSVSAPVPVVWRPWRPPSTCWCTGESRGPCCVPRDGVRTVKIEP